MTRGSRLPQTSRRAPSIATSTDMRDSRSAASVLRCAGEAHRLPRSLRRAGGGVPDPGDARRWASGGPGEGRTDEDDHVRHRRRHERREIAPAVVPHRAAQPTGANAPMPLINEKEVYEGGEEWIGRGS